jgi:nucleoside-diphosphate-sugar epimerase
MRPGDGRVIPSFCTAVLRGEPLVVYGEGRQTRSFCYMTDLVDGVVRMAKHEALTGKIVNLGNPDEFAIIDLARTISQIAGVSLRVVNAALPPDDPTRRRPAITLARTLLGWEPRVTLRDGLLATLEYFRMASDQSEAVASRI